MVTTELKPVPQEVADRLAEAAEQPVGPLCLRLPPEWRLTDDAFERFANFNEHLELERSARGELIIAPLPIGKVPEYGARFVIEIGKWSDSVGKGRVRDATGGYRMGEPDDDDDESKLELRAPDASWISPERLAAMDEDYDDSWPPFAPTFAVEIASKSQTLTSQRQKMQMWMSYGVQLGWLIDPRREQVWIYRAGQDEPELLERPNTLSGENVMQGFSFDCTKIWDL